MAERTINEEAGLPESWHPIESAPLVPGQSTASPSPAPQGSGPGPYFAGSVPSTFQYDANFVKNAYQTQGVAVTPLMPLANSAQVNAGTQTIIKSTSTVVTASAAGSDTDVQVNSGGSFYADNGFTYNKTTQNVFMGGSLSVAVNGLIIGNLGVGTFVNVGTGFQIAGGATTGQYLRGNGTNFVSSALISTDLPNSGVVAGSYTNTNLTVTAQGLITSASNGTASAGLVGSSNLTAQAANVSATTLYATLTNAGLYRITVYMIVSQAATVSSTLPDSRIIYTDRDSSATITISATSSSTLNTTSAFVQATYIVNAKASTNIQFDVGQITAYASSGATPMQFAYRARAEYLG